MVGLRAKHAAPKAVTAHGAKAVRKVAETVVGAADAADVVVAANAAHRVRATGPTRTSCH